MNNIVNIEDVILDDSERQRCEIYSRVMGYIRPTTEYNIGKMGEFKSRVCFVENKAIEGCSARQCVCNEALAMAAE